MTEVLHYLKTVESLIILKHWLMQEIGEIITSLFYKSVQQFLLRNGNKKDRRMAPVLFIYK